MESIKLILFDAGGTLLHLDYRRIEACLNECASVAVSVEKFDRAQSAAMLCVARLVAAGGGSTEQMKRQFYASLLPDIGVPEKQVPICIDAMLGLAESEMLWGRSDPATEKALEGLRSRGYRLAIVSNSDGRVQSAFEQAGLDHHFEFFIDSFLVGVEKPDPAIFRLALERAGVRPEEALYVGDLYEIDVIGARKANLIPVLYDPFGLSQKNDCLKISRLDELLELLA